MDVLKDGTIPERKALIRNFVEGIEVVGEEATLTYTVPMPSDGAMSESASVLDFVKSGPPPLTVDTAIFEMSLGSGMMGLVYDHQGIGVVAIPHVRPCVSDAYCLGHQDDDAVEQGWSTGAGRPLHIGRCSYSGFM